MPNVSPEEVFVESVGILNQHLAAVAKDIQAGNMVQAAESLKAIGDAAQWLSASLTIPRYPTLPPQMLPAQNCRPKFIDPTKLNPPPKLWPK